MSWAERTLSKLANDERDKKEEERIQFAREARIRTESGLLWDNLKQTLRKNIEEFNASKPRYFQTKDSGVAADFESYQVISPKGNITLRFYPNIPKLIVDVYSNRAPSIEEMKTDTIEVGFGFKDDAVWFAELGTCVTVPSLAERLLDRVV